MLLVFVSADKVPCSAVGSVGRVTWAYPLTGPRTCSSDKTSRGRQGGAFLEVHNQTTCEWDRAGRQTHTYTHTLTTHAYLSSTEGDVGVWCEERTSRKSCRPHFTPLPQPRRWLSDTQQWRSAHSLWRLQPLIEPCTAYNYIWAHGKIAVWCEKCHIEIRHWWKGLKGWNQMCFCS